MICGMTCVMYPGSDEPVRLISFCNMALLICAALMVFGILKLSALP
jgi:hypothetical protein